MVSNFLIFSWQFLLCYSSKDKRDIDIIRENHKFLWEDDDIPSTWEERLAKKYYDKLFKEFCITDMSKYKENKVQYNMIFNLLDYFIV